MNARNCFFLIGLCFIFSCTAQKKRFEIVLAPENKQVSITQLDSALPVLIGRLQEIDKGEVSVIHNPSSNNIIIQSACSDKNFISNVLLKQSKLEFYECYTIIDLAEFLTKADEEINNMIKAGILPADNFTKASTKNTNPLFRTLQAAQPYTSPAGAPAYPGYTGIVREQEFAKMKSYLPVLHKHLPIGSKILFKKIEYKKYFAYEVYVVRDDETKFVASDRIKKASSGFSANGMPVINIEFNNVGTLIWSRMTTKNVDRFIGIVIDGEIQSAPHVLSPIEGGKTEITGSFTVQEVNNMAASLSAGYLPAKLQFISMKEITAK
jgi:SecD/SecF fusion protein